MPESRARTKGRESAELVAVQALAFIAEDPDRLGRFLAVTGLGPETLRAAAQEPRFLAGVLDHLASDEALVVAFALARGMKPGDVARARDLLGDHWERDIP